ncbi:ADP-heptose:LPS heptosyltransferase [Nitrospirillum bahiense]|uniref:ADP-heptose:LPS heptosyltransferase n=1 Tax=Nitrospirillum amazonense TaxID=28077 RepID=A0A560EUK5_9PROT|nr:ADP-heptose:LPS heptosyltransferase [Nitrospirillum amazonense]
MSDARDGHAPLQGKFQLEQNPDRQGCLNFYGETVIVGGWAVLPDEFHSFDIFHGDVLLASLRPDGERKDVQAAYPDLPNALMSGFKVEVSLAGVAPEAREGAVLSFRMRRAGQVLRETAVTLVKGLPTGEFHLDNARFDKGVLQTSTTNIHLVGWVVAQEAIRSISAHLGDDTVMPVQFGIPRADVLAVRRTNPNGLNTGFSLFIPELPEGTLDLKFRIEMKTGHVLERGYTMKATRSAEDNRAARARTYAERRFWELVAARRMAGDGERPHPPDTDTLWAVVILQADRADSQSVETAAAFEATLASVRKVHSDGWHIQALVPAEFSGAGGPADRMATDKGDLVYRDATRLRSLLAGLATRRTGATFVSFLTPGETLDRIAPAVLAAHGCSDDVDLLYWDERATIAGRPSLLRKTPGAPFVTAFHMNFVGRGWAARLTKATLATLAADGLELFIAGHPLDRFYHQPQRCHHVAESLSTTLYASDLRDLSPVEREARSRVLAGINPRYGVILPLEPGADFKGAGPAPLRLAADLKAAPPLVSIIIPTKGVRGRVFKCLEDLRYRTSYKAVEIVVLDHIDFKPETLDDKNRLRDLADIVIPVVGPFNWSRFNNMATALSSGDVFVFLNDDVEVVDEDWIEQLLAYLNLPAIGAVGPRLLLAGGRMVQSAGVSLMSHAGWARNDFAFSTADHPLATSVNQVPRNCTSLLGAAIAVPRDLFLSMEGFEEGLALTFNDLDFHMRLRDRGHQVAVVPQAELVHHEKTSRAELVESEMEPLYWERWRAHHAAGDPYWHPDLERESGIYKVDPEPVETIWSAGIAGVRSEVRRMLLLRMDHVGDFVLTLPAFRQLRNAFPKASIEVVVGTWNRDLAVQSGLFDVVHVFNLYAARSGDGRALGSDAAAGELSNLFHGQSYDLAVDFRADGDTRFLLKHIAATTRAGYSQGVSFPWLDVSVEWEGNLPQWRKSANGAVQMRRLVSALELAFPEAETTSPSFWGDGQPKSFAGDERRLIVLHPFAGNDIKMWPAAHWAGLVSMMVAAGFTVEIVGTPAEKAAYATMVDDLVAVGATDRIGQFTLPELVTYIGGADCFVGSDSGPKHIAASTGIPTVAVQSGFVDPVTWSPFNALGVSVVKRVSCAPCYLDDVRLCGRNHDCMRKIFPAQVFRHVASLSGRGHAASQQPARTPVTPPARPRRSLAS